MTRWRSLTIPALIGPLIGPPIGGFITTYFHWRWIFWINVPVGVLGLVLATISCPISARRACRRSTAWASCCPGSGSRRLVFGFTVLGRDVLPCLWRAGA